jgi:hypothetical protein
MFPAQTMKKLISIGFVALYFVLSVGVNVLIHTCCGFRSIDVMPLSAKDPCDCSTEFSDEMCCTLLLQTISIVDDQQTTASFVSGSPDCSACVYPPADAVVCRVQTQVHSNVDPSPPPGISPIILNCVFLI